MQRLDIQKSQQIRSTKMNYLSLELCGSGVIKWLKSEAADVGASRVRHDAYEDMKHTRVKFSLPNDVPLNKETIHARARDLDQNPHVTHPGGPQIHPWLQLRSITTCCPECPHNTENWPGNC